MANFRTFIKPSQIMKATEDYILTHTLEEVRSFIKENGVIEEDEDEIAMFIPDHEHKFVHGKTYDMRNTIFGHDEFIITDDGRVFRAVSIRTNIEII